MLNNRLLCYPLPDANGQTKPGSELPIKCDPCFRPTRSATQGRSAKITATGDPSSKAHYVAREGSTSRAGAAYIFSRLEGYTSEAIETSGVSSASSAFNDVSSSRKRFHVPRNDWSESVFMMQSAITRRSVDLSGPAVERFRHHRASSGYCSTVPLLRRRSRRNVGREGEGVGVAGVRIVSISVLVRTGLTHPLLLFVGACAGSKTDSTCLSSVAAKSYYCPSGRDRTTCRWEESAKLTARDRRGGDLFGGSLAVDHDSGVAVVGAAGASLTGIWREVRKPGTYCRSRNCMPSCGCRKRYVNW